MQRNIKQPKKRKPYKARKQKTKEEIEANKTKIHSGDDESELLHNTFDNEDEPTSFEAHSSHEDFIARNIIEGLPPKYRLNFFRETLRKGARGPHVIRHKVKNMPIEERTKYFKELLNS